MTESAVATRPPGSPAGRRTIARLWRDAVTAGHPGPAYLVESETGWREISWQEADERVRAYADGLLALGIRRGDAFAILARNSLDWGLMEFALAQIGAVTVPVYASSSPHDVGYVVGHSESVGIVCEDDGQRAKVEQVASELPALKHVLTYADLDVLATSGREYAAAHPEALDHAVAAIGTEARVMLPTLAARRRASGMPRVWMPTSSRSLPSRLTISSANRSRSCGRSPPRP